MKEQVIVIGLGRFGAAVAREIEALGHEGRRAVFLESQLGVGVQVAPELGQALVMRQDRGQRATQRGAEERRAQDERGTRGRVEA